ncbi:unnamed protein product [Alopecurus aequalis]
MSADATMDDLEYSDDSSSWSSWDSDLDELLNDDEMEMMQLLFGIKELEDRAKLLYQRRGSTMGRICIPRNRALGHEQLWQDYFGKMILHNMIIEDERGLRLPCFYDNVGTRVVPERNPDRLEAFLAGHRSIECAETHHQLTQDLIDHHWQLHGQ